MKNGILILIKGRFSVKTDPVLTKYVHKKIISAESYFPKLPVLTVQKLKWPLFYLKSDFHSGYLVHTLNNLVSMVMKLILKSTFLAFGDILVVSKSGTFLKMHYLQTSVGLNTTDSLCLPFLSV